VKPDFMAQFRRRPEEPKQPLAYMGGTAMSCGQHPSLPKRHRWQPWKQVTIGTTVAWERMCGACALVDDISWTKPKSIRSLINEGQGG